ncbi:MAG: hypothetical protein R3E96_03275 [Planctomycetota bacterium]
MSAAQVASMATAAGTPLEERQIRPITRSSTLATTRSAHVWGDQETEITVRVEAQA